MSRLGIILGMLFAFQLQLKAQENPEVVAQIKNDLYARLGTDKIHNISYQDWGVYWVYASSNFNFGEPVYHITAYTEQGEWVSDKFDITHRLPEQIVAFLDSKGELAYCQMIYAAGNDPYYSVVFKSGEHLLMDVDFERIEVGPLSGDLVLTAAVKADIESRLENAYIINGYEDFNQQYSVIFKTSYVEFQNGQILYSKEGEWVETKAFLHDYFKLPLELMMYVNDRGGLENFGPVNQVTRPDEEFYHVKFKDGTTVKLDLDLNEI
ncbi:hypothetical protein N6H18_17095 [Reichenbachiella agarivorans]|uniref:Beta-lactamase-inhibitor-like, PepSY-like n=1 Tax=Reichenbachiella agarivorans TaxID=2979464 RepID=A0ABY6CNH8_9BACT|nr:hypothetical protein [Reichenbachiella agarivorans]UXP32061.1 hypothetical protein N6H18_17095 [Reichenbachiella agarivorans]